MCLTMTSLSSYQISQNFFSKGLCKETLQIILVIKLSSHDSSLCVVPPVMKDKEQITNVSVLVNQLTNLFCEVEGTPSPIIMWYKDDVQVNGDLRICIIPCLCPWNKLFRCDFLINNSIRVLLWFLIMHFY